MSGASVSPTVRRLLDFLGELGPRWGLPAGACRVHGYLYLVARPAAEAELADAAGVADGALAEALTWLADYGLVERTPSAAWRTESDPWELMMRALEERRRREIAPALDLLRACERAALAEKERERMVGLQIGKLLALAEDLAAIDMQARRLSPRALRQMIGIGGRAARFLDRTLGRRDRP
jgi:DNA-binding transcriptional regulator GbsR (MarR family)